MINNNNALQAFLAQGNTAQYIYFWGHQKPKSGVSKSCFSQWFDAPFSEADKHFKTAEHYMMYAKATLFDNPDIAAQILSAPHPNDAKKLGRQVKRFNEEIWNAERFKIVVRANRLKFEQNQNLKAFFNRYTK